MAADDHRVEYHLTPTGWVKGTSRTFGRINGEERPRPVDAVETWEEHIFQRSTWSRDEYTY